MNTNLLQEINNNKTLYNLFNAINALWVDMEEIIGKAVYYTHDFEDATNVVELVDGGETIEEALFNTTGRDWFIDHCSNTEYLDDELCDELI